MESPERTLDIGTTLVSAEIDPRLSELKSQADRAYGRYRRFNSALPVIAHAVILNLLFFIAGHYGFGWLLNLPITIVYLLSVHTFNSTLLRKVEKSQQKIYDEIGSRNLARRGE